MGADYRGHAESILNRIMMNMGLLPYCLLVLSMFLAWWNTGFKVKNVKVPLWCCTLILAVCSALFVGAISLLAVLWLALFSVLLYFYKFSHRYLPDLLVFAGLLGLSFLLASHYLPGFEYYSVFDEYWFGQSVFSTTLHIHFDRGFLGTLIFCALAEPIKSKKAWMTALKRASWAPLMLMLLFFIADYIWLGPDLKWNSKVFYYLIVSLFFVAVAEEAFFRLLLQRQIETWFGGRDTESVYVAIVATALLFTLWHLGDRIVVEMTIVFFLAGLFYAYVYGRSRSIELAILAHFSVNAIHLIFYTYPGLEM